MGNAQNLQFLFRHADAPKHQAVAPEGFNGIDTHATHQLLDLFRSLSATAVRADVPVPQFFQYPRLFPQRRNGSEG